MAGTPDVGNMSGQLTIFPECLHHLDDWADPSERFPCHRTLAAGEDVGEEIEEY